MARPTAKVTIEGTDHTIDLADFYGIICHALHDHIKEAARNEQESWANEDERKGVLEANRQFNLLLRKLRDACLDVVRSKVDDR